jgi:hypothetical protein
VEQLRLKSCRAGDMHDFGDFTPAAQAFASTTLNINGGGANQSVSLSGSGTK